MDFISTLVLTLVGLAVLVGIFLMCRYFVLWYFGIHDMLTNQEKIISLLTVLKDNKVMEGQK